MSLKNTYIGFEDIPVNNFYQISKTGDLRWFYKSFSGDRDLKISEQDNISLADRYKKVYDDRIKYTNDVRSAEYYRKLNELSNLTTKLFRITSAFDVLIDLKTDSQIFLDYIKYFKEDEKFNDFKEIKNDKDILEYINWLRLKIRGFKTLVAVKESNYSDVLKPKEIKNENKAFDIVKEKLILQESLGNVSINIYTCPLIEWCAMIMRAEEKSIESKKQLDKIKNKR
jgi:hypothetical protein